MSDTRLQNLINPQVMADMISAKLEKALVVTPFAKIDTTLAGRPGDTITVPFYSYIGDASVIAEGSSVTPATLSAGTRTYTVAKAMKAVNVSDEALLSGYGNPQGEITSQLTKAIASKIDEDCMTAAMSATRAAISTSGISYNGIVEAIDVFEEEGNTEKVMFIHPAQLTALRKDSNFLSADKYQAGVAVSGEVGKIANCRIVPSKRVKKYTTTEGAYVNVESTASGALKVVASGASSGEVDLATVKAAAYYPVAVKVNDYVKKLANASYINPIVKLETNESTEDDVAAITVYVKRDTNIETERHTLNRTTDVSVDKHYVAALTNDSKVVVAAFA